MAMTATKIECRWSLLVWLACLMMVLLLSNCASPTTRSPIATCQGIDWYEIGRRDGATGAKLDLLGDYQKQCRKDKNQADVDLYSNGRNAGLVEYCTPQVGLESGRLARPYAGVCPTHLEKSFLKGFQAGEKIRGIEADNLALDEQISALSRAVAAVNPVAETADATDTRTKLAALRKKHAANDEAISSLEKSSRN